MGRIDVLYICFDEEWSQVSCLVRRQTTMLHDCALFVVTMNEAWFLCPELGTTALFVACIAVPRRVLKTSAQVWRHMGNAVMIIKAYSWVHGKTDQPSRHADCMIYV